MAYIFKAGVASAALLLVSAPASAMGAMTTYVVKKSVEFVINFVGNAASNASAAASATAVSKQGTAEAQHKDTGYIWAKADAAAVSGNLASQEAHAYAEYNFFSPNIHKVDVPGVLQDPDGIYRYGYAATAIKGFWQIVGESLPLPLGPMQDGPAMAEIVVPVALDMGIFGRSAFDFGVSLGFEDGTVIDLVSGSAGHGGDSISMPYLEQTNPLLAAAVRDQYLGAVGGKGNVGLTLGGGLFEGGEDGVPGFSVWVPVGVPFSLNSNFGETGGDAIPEPGTWVMMIAGFGLVGMAVRRRRAALA